MNLLKKAIFACGTVMMLFVGGSISFAQEPVGQAPVNMELRMDLSYVPDNLPHNPNATLI